MKKTRRKRPIRQRFDEKWKWDRRTNCWLWGAGTSAKGYGTFLVEGKEWYAHRVAWTLYRGPIPDGLVLDHICRVRNCVNPEHLRLVTLRTNATENTAVGLHNAKKTHCPKGHPYSGDNVAVYHGARMCVTCSRTRARLRNQKR